MHQPYDCENTYSLGFPRSFHQTYASGGRLGRGNCGSVHTVSRRSDSKKFAVKILCKDLQMKPTISEKERSLHIPLIKTELEILKLLKGTPNVIQLEDVFEDDSKIYIVTEICSGGPLAETQTSTVFNEKDVVRYIRDVLEAIASCHAAGIIHRDIKGENFLFTHKSKRNNSRELKLIDFGISTKYTFGQLPVKDLGHPAGTIYFMSPEACRAEWYPESDVWAVGIMAAKMLTGVYPFTDPQSQSDPDPGKMFKAIKTQNFETSAPEWSKVSPMAAEFVRHLLVKDPIHRPTALQALQHPFIVQQRCSSPHSRTTSTSSHASLSSLVLVGSPPNHSIDSILKDEELPDPSRMSMDSCAGADTKKLLRFGFLSSRSRNSSSTSLSNASLDANNLGNSENVAGPSSPKTPPHVHQSELTGGNFLKRLKQLASMKSPLAQG